MGIFYGYLGSSSHVPVRPYLDHNYCADRIVQASTSADSWGG